MEEKRILRAEMRRLNRSLGPDERAEASRRLWAQVEALASFQKAQVVALFASLADEPDTQEALQRWSAEKRLLVPRVEGEVMHFYPYDPERMGDGSFGILEPQQGEAADPKTIDLIIVPGVAFTLRGDRMGRGKGFYDKYLVQLRSEAVKVGVCYAHQVVAELPTEEHDIAMDCIVTGSHK